jgi:uncharacterized protein (TIGR02145 family)
MEKSLIWFARFFKRKNVQKVFLVTLVILPISGCLPFILEIINGPTGIICIISASLLGIYLYMDKIARAHYKPYVYINKKYITPNIVDIGYSEYDLGSLNDKVRKRLLYTPCKTCLRKDQCTVKSSCVRQCDLYKEVVNEIVFGEKQNSSSFELQGMLEEIKYELLLTSFTDPRDGNVYKTVKIGVQLWMAENLRYIPHVCPVDDKGGIWVYDYSGHDIKEAISMENYKKYGCLYDYETAKSVCPEGWHLPTDDEWEIMINLLGGIELAGGKLKSISGWEYPNIGATNESGFSALPAGYFNYFNKAFYTIGKLGHWWSSTENYNINVWAWTLMSNNIIASKHTNDKSGGFSVRLIRD